MIDFQRILREKRENKKYNWVISVYENEKNKPLPYIKRPLSEFSLTEHLGNYENEFIYLCSFLHWNTDPRYIDGSIFPYGIVESQLDLDDRKYDPIPEFSKYYPEYVTKENPIIRTERLDKIIKEIDFNVKKVNQTIPLVKHLDSDRDFISREFAEFASLVLLCENSLENEICELEPYIKMIYDYKPGKILVTNPYYHDKIPENKRSLFGL